LPLLLQRACTKVAEEGISHLAATAAPEAMASTLSATWCCLTFELSRPHRYGAWPARRMMTVSALRAKCHAGVGRLERRVRQHCLWRTKPMREGEAHRHCLGLLAADAPAL